MSCAQGREQFVGAPVASLWLSPVNSHYQQVLGWAIQPSRRAATFPKPSRFRFDQYTR